MGFRCFLLGHRLRGYWSVYVQTGVIYSPCARTNANDVFSAKAVKASPDGFFNFRSPSLSDKGPMAKAADGRPKVGDFSAMIRITSYNFADTYGSAVLHHTTHEDLLGNSFLPIQAFYQGNGTTLHCQPGRPHPHLPILPSPLLLPA